ncbi:hypothetical protein [Planobispora longispora]|uniref:Uncharacterized protein n=1 Tax=Planobispora longispora TaxID=28887 RepID=A0A8J3W483_9ACTN|nr:hypothetical protein [Planobispora longispora]BFE85144.1 hypothetical protein GCM10020093_077450 [Planobispora longispora]GIH75185.1 hypothetical protein Plo01_16140 [Planobispora longispora]
MNPRVPFIAAPLLVLAYGVIRIIDGLDGSRGPGPAWTTGHLAFIAALVLFVPIFWQMRRMAGRDTIATVSAVTGLAGGAAFLAQFTIDIVVGFMAADHAAMGVLFDRVQSVPGVSPVVYVAGPALFCVGQLALAVRLALLGRVKAWVPALVLAYSLLPFIDKDLIPLGAVCLLVSFIPLARQAAAPVPVTAPASAPVRA